MLFKECLHFVNDNHPRPPVSFLTEMVLFGRQQLDSASAVELTVINHQPSDALGQLAPLLGPWEGELGSFGWCAHRLAALLEALRIHAGTESDWKWSEGVDRSNRSSQRDKRREETGAWQVSYDSLRLDKSGRLLALCQREFGEDFSPNDGRDGGPSVDTFIREMKERKQFAIEYAANLYRVSTEWAGPWLRHEVQHLVWKPSCLEFRDLMLAKDEPKVTTQPKG